MQDARGEPLLIAGPYMGGEPRSNKRKNVWPPVAVGQHFLVHVENQAWSRDHVSNTHLLKVLVTPLGTTRCAEASCTSRGFGETENITNSASSLFSCDRHCKSFHRPPLKGFAGRLFSRSRPAAAATGSRSAAVAVGAGGTITSRGASRGVPLASGTPAAGALAPSTSDGDGDGDGGVRATVGECDASAAAADARAAAAASGTPPAATAAHPT